MVLAGLLQVLSSLLIRHRLHPFQRARDILLEPIIPVRLPNGEVELCPWDPNIVIVDREHLGPMFRDKVKTLDFDLHESGGLC